MASLLTFGLNLAFAAMLIIWNEHVVTISETSNSRQIHRSPPAAELAKM